MPSIYCYYLNGAAKHYNSEAIGDTKMKADTKLRALTVEDSKTNQAHNVWYSEMTPMQRHEVSVMFSELPVNQRLTASLNYIEDNIL